MMVFSLQQKDANNVVSIVSMAMSQTDRTTVQQEADKTNRQSSGRDAPLDQAHIGSKGN